MKLIDKKVFLTGASRGIGKSIAERLKNEGAYVVGTSTKEVDTSIKICDDYLIANFNNDKDIKNCAEFIQHMAPDILINNAGVNKIQPFIEIKEVDFLKIQKINIFAPFVFCKAAIPSMKANGWGRIVNISSIWGKISKSGRASYSASKFALDGMTAALALEHSADGILANCLAPGFTDTELTRNSLGDLEISKLMKDIPIKRLANVEEISDFVFWLCSEDNSYMTGQNIAIDGGFTRA